MSIEDELRLLSAHAYDGIYNKSNTDDWTLAISILVKHKLEGFFKDVKVPKSEISREEYIEVIFNVAKEKSVIYQRDNKIKLILE